MRSSQRGLLLVLIHLIFSGCGGNSRGNPGGGANLNPPLPSDDAVMVCLREKVALRPELNIDAAELVTRFATATRECGASRGQVKQYARSAAAGVQVMNWRGI